MKRSRTFIYTLALQIVFSLIILDFELNPNRLHGQCSTALASSDDFGYGSIVDCIACHTYSSKNFGGKFIGSATILIPKRHKKKEQFGQGQITPYEDNRLKSNFLFFASLLSKKGCSFFECSSLHILQDLSMRQEYSVQMLKKNGIEIQKDIIFQVTNSSFVQISDSFAKLSSKYALKLKSNPIVKDEVSSIMIRTRYSINQLLQKDQQPAILVYELNNSIYIRFIILLVALMFSIDTLNNIVVNINRYVKFAFILFVFLGFLSENTAILASSLAIYLTVAKLYKKQLDGITIALLFFVVGLLYSFTLTILIIILYIVYLVRRQFSKEYDVVNNVSFLLILMNTFYMWIIGWNFYVKITPVLLMGLILAIQQSKKSQSTNHYNSVGKHQISISYGEDNRDQNDQLSSP